jgi:hypothetical protein
MVKLLAPGVLALALAACGGKATSSSSGRELVATPLDPAGPAWVGFTIDVPPGSKVKAIGPAAGIEVPGGPSLQVRKDAMAMPAARKQYETMATYKRAQVTFQVATDELLEYTIAAGYQKEHGLETRATIDGSLYGCMTLLSSPDLSVIDVARAACKSLKKK